MNLFLDDERRPQDAVLHTDNMIYANENWDTVKNYEEFTNYIKTHPLPVKISFDHDLHHSHYRYALSDEIPYTELNTKTGFHCLLWLILHCREKKLTLPKILFHTRNTQGEKNMKMLTDVYSQLYSQELP